jgi:hypothetical protein
MRAIGYAVPGCRRVAHHLHGQLHHATAAGHRGNGVRQQLVQHSQQARRIAQRHAWHARLQRQPQVHVPRGGCGLGRLQRCPRHALYVKFVCAHPRLARSQPVHLQQVAQRVLRAGARVLQLRQRQGPLRAGDQRLRVLQRLGGRQR